MRAKNNGLPEVCVENLLRTYRGEVAYERLKGLDTQNVDRPAVFVESDVVEDAQWLLNTYEPRADINQINLDPVSLLNGDFRINAEIE